jgi:hypothetical protein
MPMNTLACDGCGQPATPEHIARRLKRLEWTTRWRPIHIGTLLLGAHSPQNESAFLYAGKFEGEAGHVLEALGLQHAGKAPDTVLTEFQRGGYFLTHILECSVDDGSTTQLSTQVLLAQRIPATAARIRRSLRPKRVVLISGLLAPIVAKLAAADFGCPIVPDEGISFGLDAPSAAEEAVRLRQALGVGVSAR